MPGRLDRSTLGHPGKLSYCVAEDEENTRWRPLAEERGARQRVAAGHRASPLGRHPHRDELPRPVPERGRERGRHVQHQRAGVVGLADHLGHRHLVKVPHQGGDTSSRPAFTADQLNENIRTALEEVVRLKPSSSKGRYIQKGAVSTTFGPGIPLDVNAI